FSELAQSRLDRVLAQQGEKRIQAASAAGNPYSKGTVRADTAFRKGDLWTYRVTDLLTRVELRKSTLRLTAITDSELHFNNGTFIADLDGMELRSSAVPQRTPSQTRTTEYLVGKRWSTRFSETYASSGQTWELELDYRISRTEQVKVPAGTFDTFLVEHYGWSNGPGKPSEIRGKTWY